MQIPALSPVLLLILSFALAACGEMPEVGRGDPDLARYGAVQDGIRTVAAIDPKFLEGVNRRSDVAYAGREPAGTIVVDPYAKFLFLVQPGGRAIRYPIGAGREGRGFSGSAVIGRKAAWPGWVPTANMLRSEPEVYGGFARGIPGGLANPLGARALYLYRGGKDTHFRIHGTNAADTIGNATSAGCIRMFNQDIMDLYERVPSGTRVIVRTYAQSVAAEGEQMASRGKELPPVIVSPERIYAYVAQLEAAEAALLAR